MLPPMLPPILPPCFPPRQQHRQPRAHHLHLRPIHRPLNQPTEIPQIRFFPAVLMVLLDVEELFDAGVLFVELLGVGDRDYGVLFAGDEDYGCGLVVVVGRIGIGIWF
jgi:hypothetical protein